MPSGPAAKERMTAGRDADDVVRRELAHLAVELRPAGAGDHEVDLLGLAVAVAERIAARRGGSAGGRSRSAARPTSSAREADLAEGRGRALAAESAHVLEVDDRVVAHRAIVAPGSRGHLSSWTGCPSCGSATSGLVPFAEALALQETLRAARQADEIPDTLLLLEHPPVYTRGRRSGADELPATARRLGGAPIEVVDVDRGGRVTYHGPGQLVGYPIVRIGDVIGYLRALERAIVAALAREGVAARARGERPTGVWVGGRKIASIGVHVSRRVTTHGFADQRRQRPRAVRVDRPVRHARRRDDLDRARDRPRARRSAACAQRSRAELAARARARPSRSRLDAAERLLGAPVG